MGTIKWGILGTGEIAHKFATGLSVLPDAELVAVGSRAQETAEAFGDRFEVPQRHPSYQALAEDPDVDVVYVATPHTLHKENSILCLEAGKAVLCEKPFTINAAEAEAVVALARERGLFLMEAMWTRFFPAIERTRQLLAGGAIGAPRMVIAGFGFRAPFDPQHRLFDPNLGGGALLDVGVYPVSLTHMVLGAPTRITAMAHLGKTGVDEQAGMLLGYDQGQLGILHAAIRTQTPNDAFIVGTEGRIRIQGPWWRQETLTLSIEGEQDETMHFPLKGNGYNYEAEAVMAHLRAGEDESDVVPLDETVAIMKTMDEIRAQWGLTYPTE